MTWPVKESDKLLANGDEAIAPHEGLNELNKAQWEEGMDPEGFSSTHAAFKGGAPQPTPPKRGNLEEDFKGGVFTKLTGNWVDRDDTPKGR